MSERAILKQSGIWTIFIMFIISSFWFLFSIQPCNAGYTGGPASGIDVGINSRSTTQSNLQPGSSGVFVIRLGIENVTGIGTATGYMNGTNTYYPRIEWTPTLGTLNFIGTGSYNVQLQMNGVNIASGGSLSAKLDSVGGVGTSNTFNNPTLAGVGTITASFGANGLIITPEEYSYLDAASSNIQTQITIATGSITNHTHTGSDGTTQIAHDSIIGTGANSHPIIDTFIASKASASGIASLDANSKVIQDPASGTSTPGVSKMPISLGTGKIDDAWLSNNITKLGTPTTDNISEGSTNKYYTDARVNAAVGSLSVNALSDVIITSPANGQFIKYDGSNWVNGSSSFSVAFSEITGSPTENSSITGTPTAGKIVYAVTDKLDDWVTDTYTLTMTAQAFAEIERQRTGTQTYKHYGNLIVDGFSNSLGISDYQNGTHSTSLADIRLANNLLAYETTNSARAVGDNVNVEYRIAQSFTINGTQKITGVAALFETSVGSPSGSMTVKIVTNSGGAPSDTLADANLMTSIIPVANQWNTWYFSNAGTLTSGVYWARWYNDDQALDINWGFKDDTTQPYPHGTESYHGGTWTTQARDLAFKIIEGTSTGNISSVGYTFPSVPTKVGCALKLTGTSTNISVQLSRNNGGSYTSCSMTNIGLGTDYLRSSSLVNLSEQPSSDQVKIKVAFGSETAVRVQGIGVFGY